jgi:predicted acyl esterase
VKVVEDFPHAVRQIEHAWILPRDGCRLAAHLWLPAGAERNPAPAVVAYIPYGKRIGTRERDEADAPLVRGAASPRCASTCAARGATRHHLAGREHTEGPQRPPRPDDADPGRGAVRPVR